MSSRYTRIAVVLCVTGLALVARGTETVAPEPAGGGGTSGGASGGASGGGMAMGWRTDGTGSYDHAHPVLNWGPKQNVRWSTALPGWSNSTPVVADGRIYISAEPSNLICLALKDGKVLWQRSVAHPPADGSLKARVAAAVAHNAEIDKQEKPLRDQRAAALQAWIDDKNNQEKQQKAKDLAKRIGELERQKVPTEDTSEPRTHETNGYSSSTPVVSAGRVFVVYGTGMAACFDVEGHPVWQRMLEVPQNGWGFCASPVIADGKLLICINHLMALDPATGKDIWSAGMPAHWGTPIPTRLGDTPVLLTPGGTVQRVSDGKELASGLGSLEYNSPLLVGDTVYFIQGQSQAWKLSPAQGDKVVPQQVWHAKIAGDRYYASPVVYAGLIYAINQSHLMTVMDADTGALVYKQSLDLNGGTIFPSIVQAGGKLFISSDSGTTVVIEPGKTYRELATNALETFRSTPIFVGDVMLVRGMTRLWCIGPPEAQ